MTNLEKFEEIFGIKLDPIEVRYTDFPCDCVDYEFCKMHECDGDEVDCPAANNFCSKEYKEKES